MSSLNKIILIGTVQTDPDHRVTTTGESLTKLSLLVDRPDRGDGLPKQSDLIQVVAWRQVADSLKEVVKGELVLVDGRISSRSYEDAQGIKRYTTEVEAKEIKKIGLGQQSAFSPSSASAVPTSRPTKTKAVQSTNEFDFGDEGFDPGEVQFPEGFDAKALAKEIDEEVPF